MPRAANRLAASFVGHLRSLEWTRSRMESLMTSHQIVRRDIERVYEGLYLDAITSLENLIESLFIGLLTGNLNTSSSRTVSRVSFRSQKVAREVVYGGRRYVDWIPYNQTEQRAKAFFRNGVPFTSLSSPYKKDLEQIVLIRNTIAHRSNHSIRTFERYVIGSLPLTPRERTPAGFLRSIYRIAPRQSRFEQYMFLLARIAHDLCA